MCVGVTSAVTLVRMTVPCMTSLLKQQAEREREREREIPRKGGGGCRHIHTQTHILEALLCPATLY